MAACPTEKDELTCAICVHQYVEPRKLQGCSHSFCESCIVKLVVSLKEEEKLGSEFECPVCKLPSDSPGIEDNIHRWVTSLEANKEIKNCIAGLKNDLGDTQLPDEAKCCSNCLTQEKVAVAGKYCLSCREYYCDTCSEVFHAFKTTKHHVVVDVTEKGGPEGCPEQALRMLKGFMSCTQHPDQAVMFYCGNDKTFCCGICSLDKHKTCKQLSTISTMSKDFSQTVESGKMSLVTSRLIKHIDSVVKAIKGNNDENKKTVKQVVLDFQVMKRKIIDLLDHMENNLDAEGKAACKSAAMKNQDTIDELNDWQSKLKIVNHLLESTVVVNCLPEQSFVCVRELEQIVENIEKDLLRKGNTIKTSGIKLNTTGSLQQILDLGPNETNLLANITLPETCIYLPNYEDRAFLRKFTVKKTNTLEIHLCDGPNIISSTPTYSGIQFLPDSGFVLVDSFYGMCCIVNKDGIVTKRRTLYGGQQNTKDFFSNERHVTYFGNHVIGFSLPSCKIILLVDCDRDKETVSLKCEHVPKAICALSNGDMAVAWDSPVAFGIISSQLWKSEGKLVHDVGGPNQSYCTKVYFTKDKSGRQLKSFMYMAIDEDRLHVIQPCSVETSVYCFDFEGSPVFCYKNKDLKNPRGVALDGDGNIYICDQSFIGSVHIVSADGIGITIINEGCPSKPLAIGYNKNKNVFAVTIYAAKKTETLHFFSVKSK